MRHDDDQQTQAAHVADDWRTMLQDIEMFLLSEPEASIADIMAEFDLSDTEAFEAVRQIRKAAAR